MQIGHIWEKTGQRINLYNIKTFFGFLQLFIFFIYQFLY